MKAQFLLHSVVTQKYNFQEMQRKRQEEIETLKNELQQLSSTLESLEIDIKKTTASKQQVKIRQKGHFLWELSCFFRFFFDKLCCSNKLSTFADRRTGQPYSKLKLRKRRCVQSQEKNAGFAARC